jgi:hypothetical protein
MTVNIIVYFLLGVYIGNFIILLELHHTQKKIIKSYQKNNKSYDEIYCSQTTRYNLSNIYEKIKHNETKQTKT